MWKKGAKIKTAREAQEKNRMVMMMKMMGAAGERGANDGTNVFHFATYAVTSSC